MFHSATILPHPTAQVTQTVNAMVGPRVTTSASASCYNSNSGGDSRHSADDYFAAVTLASGFQRQN